jgi:hypothetical protein
MATTGLEEQTVRTITDRAEIADALYRYAAGLDFGDAALLESALTDDATVDLTSATAKLGLDFPALTPRDVVVSALASAVGPLDTSHSITNIRIDITGDTATARCYAQANHYLPGDGPRPDRTRHALMMNRYDAEMARDGERWRIRRLQIDCAWFEGDPLVLVALA